MPKAFELAATRLTDREVAGQTGLGLYKVRGMLNNDRLFTDEPTAKAILRALKDGGQAGPALGVR